MIMSIWDYSHPLQQQNEHVRNMKIRSAISTSQPETTSNIALNTGKQIIDFISLSL
jgi:hypothetical protein